MSAPLLREHIAQLEDAAYERGLEEGRKGAGPVRPLVSHVEARTGELVKLDGVPLPYHTSVEGVRLEAPRGDLPIAWVGLVLDPDGFKFEGRTL